MKHLPLFVALCMALPLCAESLAVNAPATTEAVKNAVTYDLNEKVNVAEGMTVLLDADMTFTLPSENPAAPSDMDKISIMPNKDGEILVSNGNKWEKSGVTVENGGTKHVKIVTVQKDGELAFDVTIDDKTVTVAPTAGGTEFSTLAFEGEGSVTKVAVAAVPTAIIPPASGEGGTQDSGLVSKYVTWLNTADKGGAMQGASEAELSDAFAMNVGGMPKLEVVAIDPNSGDHGTITIKGSYTTSADTEQTADLGDINGKIYVTYSKTLDGTAQTAEATVALQDGETATINLPEGAVFVKARVALAQPTDTTL